MQAGRFWSKIFTFAKGFLYSQILILHHYSPIIAKGIKEGWASLFLDVDTGFSKTFLFQARFQLTLMSWRTSWDLMKQWAAFQETHFQVLRFSPPPRCVSVRDSCSWDRVLTQGRSVRWDWAQRSSSCLLKGFLFFCFVLFLLCQNNNIYNTRKCYFIHEAKKKLK